MTAGKNFPDMFVTLELFLTKADIIERPSKESPSCAGGNFWDASTRFVCKKDNLK